jgi:hypothetical protein
VLALLRSSRPNGDDLAVALDATPVSAGASPSGQVVPTSRWALQRGVGGAARDGRTRMDHEQWNSKAGKA